MSATNSIIPPGKRPVELLVDIADSMFQRATSLLQLSSDQKPENRLEELEKIGLETMQECIRVWQVVLSLLPNSTLEQGVKKTLTMDAYKVISRCHHRRKELDEARQAIIKAIDEGYTDGFISLGAICIDIGDDEGAETAFRSAIAKGSMVTRARAGLGELYFRMGMEALETDPNHTAWFVRAEEEFMAAGKARFTDGFERAMDLFEAIGWKDKALSIGERAAGFYEGHKSSYGEKLKSLNARIRKMAGEDRHSRMVQGVGRQLGKVLGNREDE